MDPALGAAWAYPRASAGRLLALPGWGSHPVPLGGLKGLVGPSSSYPYLAGSRIKKKKKEVGTRWEKSNVKGIHLIGLK